MTETETYDSDSGLLQRLAAGDRAALDHLFDMHRTRLRRMVAFRMDPRLAQRVDPEDILQDAFLAAEQRLGGVDCSAGHSPFVWLRVMVDQVLVDAHRHHLGVQMRNAAREQAAFVGADSSMVSAYFVGQNTSPSQAAQREELKTQVEAALDGMKPMDREVLVLRHFEELTNAEVAEILGIEPKAASMRYVRALGRFRECLEQAERE